MHWLQTNWQFSVDISEVDDEPGWWPYAESFCRERGREMIYLGLGAKHPENIMLPRYGSSQVIFGVGDKTSWKYPAQIWVISGLHSEEGWQIYESFARLTSSMAKQSPKMLNMPRPANNILRQNNVIFWKYFDKTSSPSSKQVQNSRLNL